MNYPDMNFGDINIKISFEHYLITILYARFGYFYNSIHRHSHSNKSYELHYIPDGYGTLVANGLSYPITPGTLFMTGPDIVHEQLTSAENPMAEYCICFEIIPSTTSPRVSDFSEGEEISKIVGLLKDTHFWFGQDTQHMLSSFQQLAEETTHRYIGYYAMTKQIIEQIIIKLVRNYTHNRPSSHLNSPRTLDDNRVVIIEESFLRDYSNITLQILANRLGLSERQTQRTLKSDYGLTFTQKRTEARLNASTLLLTTTSLSISTIAHRVGYSTLEHFCQSFKKHYKTTPSAYRTLYNALTR